MGYEITQHLRFHSKRSDHRMLVCARYAYAVGKKAKSHIQIDIYICLRKKTVGRRGDSGMNNRCDTTQRKEREIERESKDYGNIEFFHLAKCKEYYLPSAVLYTYFFASSSSSSTSVQSNVFFFSSCHRCNSLGGWPGYWRCQEEAAILRR